MSDITAPLLKDKEPAKPESLKLEDVVQDEAEKENDEKKEEKEPPYSIRNEISFFFKRGIPLGLSSLLEWGVPPWYFFYFILLQSLCLSERFKEILGLAMSAREYFLGLQCLWRDGQPTAFICRPRSATAEFFTTSQYSW